MFNASLHSKVLTKRQSQAYKKMLGAPFDLARAANASNGRPSTVESGGNRGDSSKAKSPLVNGRASITNATSDL